MHKFTIPGDFREIIRSVRASLVDAQIREPPGQSGRVGNYGCRPYHRRHFKGKKIWGNGVNL